METKYSRLITTMVFSVVLALSAISGNAVGADFSVQLTNTSHGSFFTPLLITAHDGATHLFEVGEPAGTSLQAMATRTPIKNFA